MQRNPKRSLAISVVLALTVAIGGPLLFGSERVVDERHRPAGPVGSGLPLDVYLPLADPPVCATCPGGGR